MKKQYRIKKSEDIEQVLKKKNSVGNKNYIIYIMKKEVIITYGVKERSFK